MKKKILYILNPVSGRGIDRNTIFESLRDITGGSQLEVFETKGKNETDRIREKIQKGNPDEILIGGGDGTIRMVASALQNSDIPLGIIPIGSANGLAKCLGINDIDDALRAVKSGETRKLDVLKIDGELCLHLSDFGFNAGLIKKFEQEETERGMMAYFRSSLRQFQEMKPYTFGININGKKESKVEAKMLVIANGDRYGTGAIINPASKIDDGKFEIIALNPDGIDEMVEISMAMFTGTLDETENVTIYSAEKANIINYDDADFQVDGEIIDAQKEIDVICEKQKFRFLTS